MEQAPSLRLSELITSRLCHDLITPIGAISTGLELFQETLPEQLNESEEILNLISHSAQTASTRVSFFRVAFGSSGSGVSLGEARLLIENLFQRTKINFHWKEPFNKDLALKGWGRLLLNAILWMSECAPRGGDLHISCLREEASFLSLCLKTESIIIHQGTLEALEGQATIEEITPRTVPCYLIHCLAKESHKQISHHRSSSPSELVLEIRGHKEK